MTNHENGPFGKYGRGTTGHILNALCDYGIPLTTVERLNFGEDNELKQFDMGRGRPILFARYKYFDGIEQPLFYFQDRTFMNHPVVQDPDKNIVKPKFRLSLSPHLTPGLVIIGDQATPELHDFIHRHVLTNLMTEPAYQLHMAAGAFFQGGSADREGKFIYLEFWRPEGAQAVVDFINQNYQPAKEV